LFSLASVLTCLFTPHTTHRFIQQIMPRYFCDYCDMYLTKDSAGGRKEHRRGWKHRENVIAHFKPSLKTFMSSGDGNTWQGWQNSKKGGQGPPPLPFGWEQHTTGLSKHEDARPYYIHTLTGITTWVHPRLLKPEEMPENGGTPHKSWVECVPIPQQQQQRQQPRQPQQQQQQQHQQQRMPQQNFQQQRPNPAMVQQQQWMQQQRMQQMQQQHMQQQQPQRMQQQPQQMQQMQQGMQRFQAPPTGMPPAMR
tara:strand:+ start:162 stop:914 length:753 start_codon:yes stop_codon:yes gene_type:complete